VRPEGTANPKFEIRNLKFEKRRVGCQSITNETGPALRPGREPNLKHEIRNLTG
jgi:hypothetical protein